MTKTQDTAFAEDWAVTRAGASEQIGGDAKRIVQSHEDAWRRTRAGTVGSGLPEVPKSMRRPLRQSRRRSGTD